ncbi:MAG: HAD family hydrolase [Candidatus Methanoplasma sp.]|jgi:HAD superfamily hydrolase (TIGR01509 family)|nr:HAD family hydrolase [Candidatus Methanoplasma sp.]
MKTYGFYIFDLDNTLLDSRKGYEEAFIAAFGEFGMPYDPALYGEYISTPLKMTFSKYCPNSQGAYRDFVSVINRTYERTYLNGVRLFPDAERCIDRLHWKGCGLGIVSNSYMKQIAEILVRLGVDGMFSSVIGRDSVAFPKPDPEPVLLCMSEMGASPNDSVMVGDSVNDILAGKNAGLFSVLIDRRGEGIPRGECDAVIGSLDELCV